MANTWVRWLIRKSEETVAKDDLALHPTHGFSCYYHVSTGRNFSQLSELWCMLVLTEAMTLLRNTSLKCRMPDGSEALVSNVGVWVNHSSCQRPCRITETGNWLYHHISAVEKRHMQSRWQAQGLPLQVATKIKTTEKRPLLWIVDKALWKQQWSG